MKRSQMLFFSSPYFSTVDEKPALVRQTEARRGGHWRKKRPEGRKKTRGQPPYLIIFSLSLSFHLIFARPKRCGDASAHHRRTTVGSRTKKLPRNTQRKYDFSFLRSNNAEMGNIPTFCLSNSLVACLVNTKAFSFPTPPRRERELKC